MRDVELFREQRRGAVDLVTDHQVGRPLVVQFEVPANAPARDLGGVVPTQDTALRPVGSASNNGRRSSGAPAGCPSTSNDKNPRLQRQAGSPDDLTTPQ